MQINPTQFKFNGQYRQNQIFTFFKTYPINTRLILMATFFAGLGAGINEVNFNYYLLSLGYNEIFIATLTSLGTLTAAIASIPMSFLVNKVGRRNAIVINQLISWPLFLLQVLLPISPIILGASVVSSLVSTMQGLSERPLLIESTEEGKRVNVFSLVTMTSLVAVISGNFFGGKLTYLATQMFSLPAESPWAYRAALFCTSLLSGIAMNCYLRLKHVPISADHLDTRTNSHFFKRLFGNLESFGFIWKLLLGQMLIGFGAGFTVPLFSLFFKKVYHATADQWGTISSIAKLPMFFGVMISPKIARKFGSLKTVVFCQYLSIPFLLLTLYSPNIAVAGFGFAIRHALMNMTEPIWASFYMGMLKPKELSTVSSFITVGWNTLNATGTRIGGSFLESGKHQWSFYITGLAYIIASSFYSIVWQKHMRKT